MSHKQPMSTSRLIVASLVYHWRVHAAVACGAAVGTAVLTGALLVGDSMRGSLRDLTLDRLGRVDEALVTDRFFREELADELSADPEYQKHFVEAVPAVLLRASLEWTPDSGGDGRPARANRVNLIGCDERFWSLGAGRPESLPGPGEIVLNEPLAERLATSDEGGADRVEVGDRVIVRLPEVRTVPTESLLAPKQGTVRSHVLSVSAVIPAEGLGRFGLHPSQQQPLNAYVSLGAGRRLWAEGRVNAILAAGPRPDREPPAEGEDPLAWILRPTADDYGIRVERREPGYVDVTTDRMLFDPAAERDVLESLAGFEVQPVLTYLANTIGSEGKEIPYSTVAAVDFVAEPPLGPFVGLDGEPIAPPADDEIVLNAWAADDLGVQPGATIRLAYFEPETTHGRPEERTATFRLAAVARLTGPAADPGFTPEVPGVTDAEAIADWEPPFQPFHRDRIRARDEQYWEEHGATPKAFLPLSAGRRLWASRFGQTTSFRVKPGSDTTAEQVEARLRIAPSAMGFVFQPVKRQGLVASQGATSFSGLFVGFSFFLIAAAVMLVALLFRLGIDGRANQIGILLAVGLGRRRVLGLLAGEGLVVAAAGSLVGIAAGVAYAALMLAALTSEHWWLAAVGTPFLRLHAGNPATYLIGYSSGVLAALGAIVWAVWHTRRTAATRLLASQVGDESPAVAGRSRWARSIGWMALAGAVLLAIAAALVEEQTQAGLFFGAGALTLIALLSLTWVRLRAGTVGSAVAVGRGNLLRLGVRNLARNPGRSTLTIGLVASACFLIVSISAFHVDPTDQTPKRDSGNGGFALVAESDQPIHADLNTPEGRFDLGFAPDEQSRLETATVYSLRVRSGDEASCVNLYKPQEPRLLGVPEPLIERGGFAFEPWVACSEAERENPWRLLERDLGQDRDGVPLVPMVLDAAGATYSLHLSRGNPTIDMIDDRGRTVRLRAVGVLPGSVFQGDLLLSETSLLRHFPDVSGYRFFLIEAPRDQVADVRRVLERGLGDFGLSTETSGARLARFLVVQNTYLSTFQSLGGLGLLLGTFGLAAVQLRSVFERRRELALMRATGFRRRALAWLVTAENGLLLAVGLGCGVLAALVAVLPHLFGGGASIPWRSLAVTLLVVMLAGLSAGLTAVRAVLQAPLLAALRGE